MSSNTLKLVWKDADSLSIAAAHYFILAAKKSIAKKDSFIVALSGGSTPKKLFQLLASASFCKSIDWKKVFIIWGDERFVPHSNEESNYKMAKEALLQHVAIPKKNILAIPTSHSPEICAAAYQESLKVLLGKKGIIDLTLLGMGDDGHTASLFPNTDILYENKKWVKEVWLEDKQVWRISLTYPLLNKSNEIMFLVAGAAKAPIIKHIFAKSAKLKFPVQNIQLKKGTIMWLLDEAAVQK